MYYLVYRFISKDERHKELEHICSSDLAAERKALELYRHDKYKEHDAFYIVLWDKCKTGRKKYYESEKMKELRHG